MAQEKYTTYFSDYAQQEYDIDLSLKGGGKFSIYLYALSLDNSAKKGGFLINQKQHGKFMAGMEQAKTKYAEWVEVAKANNVKDMTKDMNIRASAYGFFLYGSKWKFDYSVRLNFEFKIIETDGEVQHLLIVRSGKMVASDNQFMDTDGVVLVFKGLQEINDFMEPLAVEKINEFEAAPKQEDLFKD